MRTSLRRTRMRELWRVNQRLSDGCETVESSAKLTLRRDWLLEKLGRSMPVARKGTADPDGCIGVPRRVDKHDLPCPSLGLRADSETGSVSPELLAAGGRRI